MKKFLSLLLAAAMAFSLAACRQTNAADRAASLRSENDADASAAEVSPEEPTAAADGNILIAYFPGRKTRYSRRRAARWMPSPPPASPSPATSSSLQAGYRRRPAATCFPSASQSPTPATGTPVWNAPMRSAAMMPVRRFRRMSAALHSMTRYSWDIRTGGMACRWRC